MAGENSPPTVKEIAAHCGVSLATVSRVLNKNYKHGFSVSKELQQRILQVADELGYRPNIAAKNLVQRKTKMVGFLGCKVLLGWPGNMYMDIIDASVNTFHTDGYDVCITVPNSEENNDTELPSWRVDGAIVLQECSQQTIELMERTKLPYVVINGVGGPSCSSIIPDDVEGTQRAMSYLMELGHTRIAYAGPTLEHWKHRSIEDRHNTYLSEMSKHGLEPVHGHNKIFNSATAFLASAVIKHHATAILAYDHIEALKIIHKAHMLDIQIPRQVSLICFNDEYMCDIVTPALTTIAVPTRKIGREAAQVMLRMIKSKSEYEPECKKLSPNLIVRESTAPFSG